MAHNLLTTQRAYYLLYLFVLPLFATAQPQPGDVFREYVWQPGMAREDGSFLRVGGKFDYRTYSDYFPASQHADGYITLPHTVDLDQATRAEVQVERVQSHEGTRGLAIEVNQGAAISFPSSDSIPDPAYDYMRHDYPIAEVPITQLTANANNAFRLQVDTVQDWGWPQHLIYGVIFRIYYDADKPHPTGAVTSPQAGGRLDTAVVLAATAGGPTPVRRIDYLGYYRDVNLEGDGVYRQWHYRFHHGELTDHLGSATAPPYRATWDTRWVPDQTEPMQLAARITDTTGLTYITEPVNELTLGRTNFSVALCPPYDQPKPWVTRSGTFTEHFRIQGDLSRAQAYQLVWVSWSPCYANGIYVNEHLVFANEGPCYEYMQHVLTLEDTRVLHAGENSLTTGKTPLYQGEMVHGMEVQWPGIMVKVKYEQ